MLVIGDCGSNSVNVRLYSYAHLQASGTKNNGGSLQPLDANLPGAGGIGAAGGNVSVADLNVIVRSDTSAAFTRMYLHGELNGATCTFWGTTTPSS